MSDDKLPNVSDWELAIMWCSLHRFEWDARLGEEEKPKQGKENWAWHHPRRRHYMLLIEQRVGDSLIDYAWNHNRMTKDEHKKRYTKIYPDAIYDISKAP